MIKVYLNQPLGFIGLDIYIVDEDPENGTYRVAEPMELKFKNVDLAGVDRPTLHLGRLDGPQFLSALSEALINAGFRDKAVSKDGEIKRMENHLADMQKIAFKFINEEKRK